MTIEEWKATASKEAVEQYDKPVGWFRENVKCCYNCPHWMNPPHIDYAVNCCDVHIRLTYWDCFCDNYTGNAKEENLIDYAKIMREKGVTDVDNH